MKWPRITSVLLLLALVACEDFATAPDRVPASLSVTPDTLVMTEGGTDSIQVRVYDRNGTSFERIPTWGRPRWSPDKPEVVSVASGTFDALAPGATAAEVSVGGLSGHGTVLVNPERLEVDVHAAYLTQATQRPDRSVPLVAGRDAFLRVFLRGGTVNFFQTDVRVTIHPADGGSQTLLLSREGLGVPIRMRRDSLLSSWNVTIPGSLIEPGTELVVEADPDGTLPLASGSEVRYPAVGRLSLDVTPVPTFYLRYVPVHLTAHGTTGALAPADPRAFSRLIHAQFPLSRMDLDVRTVYSSDARLDTREGWSELLSEIDFLAYSEEAYQRYYYGIVERPSGTNYLGIAYVGGYAGVGVDDRPATAAHELGHNFGLPHAPCGGPANPDPEYPYVDGSIGTFGYDNRTGDLHHPARVYDLMSYCAPSWVSDYNYTKVLSIRDSTDWSMSGDGSAGRTYTGTEAHRAQTGRSSGTASRGSDTRTADAADVLILWGRIEDGRLVLEPAFHTRAPVALPRRDGPYRITGYDDGGAQAFSFSFQGKPVDHRERSRHFIFAIPMSASDVDRLNRIVLSGPAGTVDRTHRPRTSPRRAVTAHDAAGGEVLRWTPSDYPAALIRDRSTGRILGIDRDGRFEVPGAPSELDVLLSDGVRTTRADLR